MHSFKILLLLIILGTSSIRSKSVRKELSNIKATTTSVKPVDAFEDKLKCDEKVCPQIDKPVCSLVNGKSMTAPTRCELDNKIRCSKVLRSVLGSKVPVLSYLHDGECRGNENGDSLKNQSAQKKKISRKPKKNRNKFYKTRN